MKTAILLIGFNRVDYFDETLTSLEANEAAHACDLHVYLDGGPKARQADIMDVRPCHGGQTEEKLGNRPPPHRCEANAV